MYDFISSRSYALKYITKPSVHMISLVLKLAWSVPCLTMGKGFRETLNLHTPDNSGPYLYTLYI